MSDVKSKEKMESELYEKLLPTRLFFRCAIPAVITSVFGALYSVVDGVFVGRFIGENALAAISLVMPIIMIVESISNMIATGASVNIAMLLGKKKREEASRVFSFSVKFILLFSCVISALGIFFARPFVELISPGATEEAIALAADYLRVFSFFGPLIPIYFATDNYLRVCGRQNASMVIGIITQVINVLLDFLLIAVFHFGVKAAAMASCISIVVGSAVTLLMFCGKRMDLYYAKKSIPAAQFFRIAANGASEFFSNIAISIMSFVMNLFLLKYGGTTAVAAFSVVMYIDSIVGMLNFGICDSLQPAISYCFGAGSVGRMKAIFKRVLIATIMTAAVAFLFMLFVGPYAATVFVKASDTTLLAESVMAIRIFAFSYLVGWIDMCYSSYFTAIDRPVRSFLVSLFGTLVFPVAFLSLLAAIWKLNGVWLASPISAIASGILTLIFAKTLKIKAPADMVEHH